VTEKIYRDGLKLNDMVTVELPAGLIVAATANYAEAEWSSGPVSHLFVLLQEYIMDPVYWNEQQAAHQQMHDQHNAFGQAMFAQLLQQQPPQDPRAQDPRFDGDDK